MGFFKELKLTMLEGEDPEKVVISTDDFCCVRRGNRASFAFENVFADYRYPVSFNFLPSGSVIVVVGGARYRCQATQIFRVVDESANEYQGLSHLKFSIEAGDIQFNISQSVHEQLLAHSEFQAQKIMAINDDTDL